MNYPLDRKYILIIGLVILGFPTLSQPRKASFQNLERSLKDHHFQGLLEFKNFHQKLVKEPVEAQCFVANHNYIYFKERLLLNLDGTGHLYEIGDSLKRIDNTCYEGYNNDAYYFVNRDTLFSLGGYGYWLYNGMLRYYDEKIVEWSVLTTNKFVPVRLWINSKPYFDQTHEKIYVIYTIPQNIAFTHEGVVNDTAYVQCLDLKTRKWWDQPGYLNRSYWDKAKWIGGYCYNTSEGLLILDASGTGKIFDFTRNEIRKISDGKSKELFSKFVQEETEYKYVTDSLINFYSPGSDKVMSIAFRPQDIGEKIGNIYSIPQPNEGSSKLGLLLYTLGILATGSISFLLAGIWFKRKNRYTNEDTVNIERKDPTLTMNRDGSFRSNLTELEIAILDLLTSNTLSEKKTQVGQLNQTLGLSKKPVKIQNNIRASAIAMINKKFMVYANINDELIVKERTEFDKRFFEYSIDKRFISKIK